MSTHIGAAPGQIAEHILLPGDPLRAEWIRADLSRRRAVLHPGAGMLGFTGTYRASASRYRARHGHAVAVDLRDELLKERYGVRTLIRVGSCGAMQSDLAPRRRAGQAPAPTRR